MTTKKNENNFKKVAESFGRAWRLSGSRLVALYIFISLTVISYGEFNLKSEDQI